MYTEAGLDMDEQRLQLGTFTLIQVWIDNDLTWKKG